jgi:hypothetical protein
MPASCPPPVYAEDQPLIELGAAELFVVAALRLRVVICRDPAGVHPDWRRAFALAGIAESGAPAFERFFEIVAQTARRSLDVRCPRCRQLGRDEGLLLQLVSLLQRDEIAPAEAVLADWLPAAAARLALPPVRAFAAALATAGLTVPRRHAEAAVVHRSASYAHAAPGLALLQRRPDKGELRVCDAARPCRPVLRQRSWPRPPRAAASDRRAE